MQVFRVPQSTQQYKNFEPCPGKYKFVSSDLEKKLKQALKKRFNLLLVGKAKWYLGIEIKQTPEHIISNQEQYV